MDKQLNTSLGIIGCNLFVFCNNNPINLTDSQGNKPGDLFATMDEAARDAAEYMGPASWETGWEYATELYAVEVVKVTYIVCSTMLIIIRQTKTYYTYSTPNTDQKGNSVCPFPPPQGKKREAMVHTHPLGSYVGITQPSPEDKRWAALYGVPVYTYGPNGILNKYDPVTEEDVDIFTDLPVSPKTPWLE